MSTQNENQAGGIKMTRRRTLSICVSTRGRIQEVERLCQSLIPVVKQGFEEWEILFVDQNPDSRIRNLAQSYQSLLPQVRYVATPKETGASKGRNIAFKEACGEWLLFSDDDAWMIPDIMRRIQVEILDSDEQVVWLGRMVDLDGKSSHKGYPISVQWITDPQSLWAVSGFCLISRVAMDRIGLYDERLGLGTYFGGDEDTDLLLRGLDQGLQIRFDPDLTFGHMANSHPSDAKVLGLARGRGALLGKYESTPFGRGLRQSVNQYLWNIRWKRPLARILGRKESAHHKQLILSGVPQGYHDWKTIYG